MIVQCGNCRARFRVADEKVPERGVKVRCSKCSTVFKVTKADAIDAPAGRARDEFGFAEPTGPHTPGPAATPPRPQAMTGAVPLPAPGQTPRLRPNLPPAVSLPYGAGSDDDALGLDFGAPPPLPSPPPARAPIAAPPPPPANIDAALDAAMAGANPFLDLGLDLGSAPQTVAPPPPPPPQPRVTRTPTPKAPPPRLEDPFADVDLGSPSQPAADPFADLAPPPPPPPAFQDDPFAVPAQSESHADPFATSAAPEAPPEPAPERRPDGPVRVGSDIDFGEATQGPALALATESSRAPVELARINLSRGGNGVDPVEPKPPPAPPPKPDVGTRVRREFGAALFNALSACVVGFAALFAVASLRSPRPLGPDDLGFRLVWIALGHVDEADDAPLRASEVATGTYVTRGGKELFFVRGVAENASGQHRNALHVAVELLRGDQLIGRVESLANLNASPEDLYTLDTRDNADLQRRLATRSETLAVAANSRVPFVAVFGLGAQEAEGTEVRINVLEGVPAAFKDLRKSAPAAPAPAEPTAGADQDGGTAPAPTAATPTNP